MKSILAILLLGFVCSEAAFDVSNFVKKNCIENTANITCRNFSFTWQEKEDIQKTKFTISTSQGVVFENANIGVLNENLVNKFPNALFFQVNGGELFMNSSVTSISTVNSKCTRLILINPKISKNVNSTALEKLTGLTKVQIVGPQLEHKGLDATLFAKNTNLDEITFAESKLENIAPTAFVNNKKLLKLNLAYNNLYSISETLLKTNTLLKEVNFMGTGLADIPLPDFFPKTVEAIDLSFNQIQVVTSKHFTGLTKLTKLYLENNLIRVVSPDAFTINTALQVLYLSNNQIDELVKKHFEKLLALRYVTANSNRFNKLPNDIFDANTKLIVTRV